MSTQSSTMPTMVMKHPRMLTAIDEGTSMHARPASVRTMESTRSRALRTRVNSLFIGIVVFFPAFLCPLAGGSAALHRCSCSAGFAIRLRSIARSQPRAASLPRADREMRCQTDNSIRLLKKLAWLRACYIQDSDIGINERGVVSTGPGDAGGKRYFRWCGRNQIRRFWRMTGMGCR